MPPSLRRALRRAPLVAAFVLLGLFASQLVQAAPPTARFNVDDATPAIGQTVNFSSTSTDPDMDITTYEWDFNYDGTTFTVDATGSPSASTSYAAAGEYRVALRVTDDVTNDTTNDQDLDERIVTVAAASNQNPTASFTVSASPTADQPVTFTSTSTDPDGDALTYEWSFGDGGSGTGSPATHTYDTSGDRTVTLTVRDGRGGSNSVSQTVSVQGASPTAGFIFDPPTPAVNKAMTFSSTSSDPDGDPLTYAWNFGDGTSGSGPNPTKTYTSAGTYNVTLTVTDPSGDSDSETRSVMVQLSVPNGSFTSSPGAPLPGQAVTFTSTSSASEPGKSITAVEWDFDYNRSNDTFTVDATGASASFAFATAGTKSVAMRVHEGPAGGFDVVPGTVTVNAPPNAAFTLTSTSAFVGDTITASSTSSDPDGPIARQDWDLDNDGQYDDANAGVVSAKFRRAGTYTLGLRVTDSQGATATSAGSIKVRRRPLTVLRDVDYRIRYGLRGAYTEVVLVGVTAPKGSKVTVRCLGRRVGRGCSRKVAKRSKGLRKEMLFKKFPRIFRPRMKIAVTVTRKNSIGLYRTYVMRRGLSPLRRDKCLVPGAKRPRKCPRR